MSLYRNDTGSRVSLSRTETTSKSNTRPSTPIPLKSPLLHTFSNMGAREVIGMQRKKHVEIDDYFVGVVQSL